MFKRFIRKILGKKETPLSVRKPHILQQAEHGIDPRLLSSNAVRVINILEKAGYDAYLVGGAVRDLLLGVRPKDFDVATNATPEQVRRLFRRAFLIGRRFQIVHVMFGQDLIEVTTFRSMASASAIKDADGRLLRDNTFGTQKEDATRRDFTVNAMYYNPTRQTLHDYHGGMADLDNRVLKIIGDPAERFREDPVRMLRVVRFAAKLDFKIDAATRKPIADLAPLLGNVPSARLFDEILKLLMSGHALACLEELRRQGLHHNLLPLLDLTLKQPQNARFVSLALEKTDQRIQEEKPVSPGFIFAALLWPLVAEKWAHYRSAGEYPIPALHAAASDILDRQTEKLAIQRRLISDMRDIWTLQPRLERRTGKTVYKLMEHGRFRAAYDFLVLRCEAGETDPETGQWWSAFLQADASGRDELLKSRAGILSAASSRKRRRGNRRRNSAPTPAEQAETTA